MAEEIQDRESSLVHAARAGDKAALEELMTHNWAWLRCVVFGIVRQAEDVDDILQEICVKVIRKIGTLRNPECFRQWLAALAKRHALRYRSSQATGMVSLDDERVSEQYDTRLASTSHGLERSEQCQQVVRAIRRLPDKYREVFLLQYSGDMTYRQIAEVLNVPLTTVQIRLVRARRMILDTVNDMSQRSQEDEGRRTATGTAHH